jgi:hypothetical protein
LGALAEAALRAPVGAALGALVEAALGALSVAATWGLLTAVLAASKCSDAADPSMFDGPAAPAAPPEADACSPWTTMTLPQVLQRMRRIFCLTFSSAIE